MDTTLNSGCRQTRLITGVCPYSNYPVAAAVDRTGQIHLGVNIENASYRSDSVRRMFAYFFVAATTALL